MTASTLEHVNITVSDLNRTAKMLSDIFGWHIRWQGPSIHNGQSIHVGSETDYIVIYSKGDKTQAGRSYDNVAALNHIGIIVDDLDSAERRVITAGYEPFSHADYEPGRRFYFRDHDNIEFEVINYD